MAYCKKCGEELNPGANICPCCGESTSPSNDVEQRSESNEVTSSNKPKPQIATSTTKKVKVAHKRKKKETNHLTFWIKVALGIGAFLLLLSHIMKKGMDYYAAVDEKDKSEQTSISKEDGKNEPEESRNEDEKKVETVAHEFFENGYKYSASFRVDRKQGYGISCNYQYVIRIYNDGTKEISASNQTDNGSPSTQGTNPCKINKKSESYKDVYAKWYEVTFDYGATIGGRYCISSVTIYVDENGNVIMLHENGNDKNIQEAISTNDCVFGKFSKERMTKEVYRCKTCGEEYDPTKEPIYNEEYCFKDYPQICKKCGKRYTVRQEGTGAGKEMCSSCYNKWQATKTIEHATGR